MKKSNFRKVLALTVVFALMMSNLVFAAPGERISNELEATFVVTESTQIGELSLSASTRDSGTSTDTDKGGYIVNLEFDDGTTMGELSKLEVMLYRDSIELVKNTMAFNRIDDGTKVASRVSCPFNIGTEGNNQWAWDRGAFPITEPLDESEVPTKVVVNYTKDGVDYTFEQDVTLRLPIQQAKNLGVAASTRNANMTPTTDKGGYSVTLEFDDGTIMDNLSKLEVLLYRNNVELVKNTMAFNRIDDGTKAASRVSCPFNIGTEGNNQWAWDRGAFPITEPLDESEVPTKVVVNYTKDGVDYTFTQEIALTLPVQANREGLVNIDWNLNNQPIDATVGEVLESHVEATLADGVDSINGILVIEVSKEGIEEGDFEFISISGDVEEGTTPEQNAEWLNDTCVASDGKLTFYWGPEEGTVITGSMSNDVQFKFNTDGTYVINIYLIEAPFDYNEN